MLGPQASSPAVRPPGAWREPSRRPRLLCAHQVRGGNQAGEDACGPSISAPNSPEQLLKREVLSRRQLQLAQQLVSIDHVSLQRSHWGLQIVDPDSLI